MKLIDILAREMDEWPADYSQSVWQLEDGRLIFTFGRRGEKYFTLASDWVTAVVTREQWEKARREMWEGLDWVRVGSNLSYRPEDVAFKKPEWRGPEDGLPPPGFMCEVYDDESSKWRECMALNAVNGSGVRACVALNDSGDFSMLFWGERFRPIKPKSDRDRWIDQACEAVDIEAPDININIDCSHAIRKTIEVIYDAGLGKLKEEE